MKTLYPDESHMDSARLRATGLCGRSPGTFDRPSESGLISDVGTDSLGGSCDRGSEASTDRISVENLACSVVPSE